MKQSMSQVNTHSISVTVESIQEWLVTALSEQLGISTEDINVSDRLDSYGLDSANALFLLSKAEKLLGIKISPMMLWHYPTIESLSMRLVEEFEDAESEVLEF